MAGKLGSLAMRWRRSGCVCLSDIGVLRGLDGFAS